MMNRKGAVSMAIVAAVTASAASAMAAEVPSLSLEPSVASMDEAAAPAPTHRPLMQGLDKLGAASFLDRYNINIYGWVEGSYTYNHKHINRLSSVTGSPQKVGAPGLVPFNHQAGDNFMGNQLAIRIERQLQTTEKFDIGGMVEVMYGSDAAAIHSNGLEYGNTGADARFWPVYQFDIPQAYIDFSVGVKGLSFRVGKFYTIIGNEVINPEGNALFSHSYTFYSLPFTHTGVLAMYQVNDQLKVTAGITRGWDQATEDAPSCAVDFIWQIAYNPNAQWSILFNGSTGPENATDTSHYRTLINPIVIYRATDALSFTVEGLYIYDGNYNGATPAAYGDVWSVAAYASYKINDYFTVNGRAEKYHNYNGLFDGVADNANTNIYSFTLGVTITPFPTDPLGSGLKFRPEVRYDCGEDAVFTSNTDEGPAKGQLTFGFDIYYAF